MVSPRIQVVLLQWLRILRFSNWCRTQMQMDEVAVTFITLPPTNQNVEFSHKACVFLSIEASRSGTWLLHLAPTRDNYAGPGH